MSIKGTSIIVNVYDRGLYYRGTYYMGYVLSGLHLIRLSFIGNFYFRGDNGRSLLYFLL